MQEIKKYVGIYLLVYIAVLIVCGFFQYITVCQIGSLGCALNAISVNSIITTTSYVLTPMVAIIGFLSWKNQYNKVTVSQLAKVIYGLSDELNILAFRYRGCISDLYNKKDNGVMRNDFMVKMNQVFDEIRLLSKLTNNEYLEKLNESNRTAIHAIVFNIDIQIGNNIDISEINKNYYVNYDEYAKILKKIRNELSNYIIV